MNQNAQQKLLELIDLQEAIYRAEARIEEILGRTPARKIPKEKKRKAYKKVDQGQRKCGLCGKPGHRRESCQDKKQQKKEPTEKTKEVVDAKPKSPERTHEETLKLMEEMVDENASNSDITKKLGLTNSTIQQYRSQINKRKTESFKPEDHKDRKDILSAVDFLVVKEMLEESPATNTPVKIAQEIGLSLVMVNEIIRAKGHSSYASYAQSKNPNHA